MPPLVPDATRPASQPPAAATGSALRPSRTRAALAGLVAGAVAIAASELVAGIAADTPSLLLAVASLVISLQPPGVKGLVVDAFGTDDKLALNVAVLLAALGIAAAAGVLSRRGFAFGALVFAAVGALGFVAAVTAAPAPAPMASFASIAVAAVVAVAAGLSVLGWLLRSAREVGTAPPSVDAARPGSGTMPDWRRRSFLVRSAWLAGAAVVAGSSGRYLLDHRRSGAPAGSSLPASAVAAPPLAPDQSLAVTELTPLVTPNHAFYRVDTALGWTGLIVPIEAATWRLDVTGMVERSMTFTYEQLLAMPLFEQYVTIACVSNRVGSDLVGNALWTGVRLDHVLGQAGVLPGATQIVGRSVDGFTAGFPTAWALDPSRASMIAVGMNGVPLPAAHGYPARLVIPGLFGYASATKWLSEIELTTREAFDGYWVRLGWAKDAPILTQSRIDHPRNDATLEAGATSVSGMAWAPDRGVAAVEVRIDDGAWQAAQTSRPISDATWVQWLLPWQATLGKHLIEVRAIDGRGEVQTAESSPPEPDGARGHHRVRVSVV